MAKFFFQLVFAGTAATIVSRRGRRAHQVLSFIIFSFLLVAFIYPIAVTGSGAAAGSPPPASGTSPARRSCTPSAAGLLWRASSSSARASASTAGRLGEADPRPQHDLGDHRHFVLWLGWFGFNPGTTMAADRHAIGHIAVTTNSRRRRLRHRDRSRPGAARQAGLLDDPQRLPCGSRRHHGAVRVGQRRQLAGHRLDRRRPRGLGVTSSTKSVSTIPWARSRSTW